MNKVILMGNLTRDIEIRYSQSGSAIGNTGIATNRRWKSQTGEQKEEVMFIDLTFFGRTAEIANQYLRKGSKVLIDGRLTLDQWTAQDGTKRSKHAVVVENLHFLPKDGGENSYNNAAGNNNANTPYGSQPAPQQQYGNPAPAQQPQQQAAAQTQAAPEIPSIDINEEEIPF